MSITGIYLAYGVSIALLYVGLRLNTVISAYMDKKDFPKVYYPHLFIVVGFIMALVNTAHFTAYLINK